MSVIQRVVKPTTRKGKKVLLKKEPQLIEGPKRALFFQGRKCSEKIQSLLKDLYDFKKPDAVKLNRKNDINIFENSKPVEDLCKKYETPLFMLGSRSKKRPDNLVVGRMFNYNLLDMIELYVESYEGLKEFAASKITVGTKPCLLFNGALWEQMDELKQLKSLFIDFFHRECVENIRLQGIEHSISFNATPDGKILLRSYKILLKKSGERIPRVELEEIGPRIDFSLRRSKLPDEDLMKEACRKPKELKVTKKKNISTDNLGNKQGRIHLGKQEIKNIQTRKMKGLKKTAAERKAEKAKILRAVNSQEHPVVNGHNER
ncbi:ribosome production factor 2 homolog [Diorhabda carinulata]|uniref:ribosome production factor 2 homolog n=1 Tax=Diorhabda sublineata TaxID=1163346 RepID=UPI0024E112F6|nr:ribosome production factor 2 homolog [Diorhabda sublineata]XP_057669797.1 ribosome production factor 2 homolog [Diorhabda carinulata]